MKNKKCTKCKLEKPLEDFHNSNSAKDGKHCYCKKCAKAGAKKAYIHLNQKDKMTEHARNRRDRLRKEVGEFKANLGCCFCSEKTHVCLDFHHTNSDKDVCVSKLCAGKSPKVIEEINKCIVVCSNCHRKIHAGILDTTGKETCKIDNLESLKPKERKKKKYLCPKCGSNRNPCAKICRKCYLKQCQSVI